METLFDLYAESIGMKIGADGYDHQKNAALFFLEWLKTNAILYSKTDCVQFMDMECKNYTDAVIYHRHKKIIPDVGAVNSDLQIDPTITRGLDEKSKQKFWYATSDDLAELVEAKKTIASAYTYFGEVQRNLGNSHDTIKEILSHVFKGKCFLDNETNCIFRITANGTFDLIGEML